MEKLPMCRICLAEDVRLYVVVTKDLHELYERLTHMPFVTKDSRPILACSFCCAELKRSCRLLRRCLEAEELFAQIMEGNYEPKPLVNKNGLQFPYGFIISPIQNINIVEVGPTESVVVKEELPAVCERQDDILEPKEEYQSDDLELGNLDNHCIDVGDVLPPHESEPDSEDDVPLMEFRIIEEEEQEVSKEECRAVETNRSTVAKKPKLHLRRSKSEDSIPADQKTNQVSDSTVIRSTRNRTSKAEYKKPQECEICLRNFSHKSNLTRHIRVVHTGNKLYKCDICQQCFGQKTNLTYHVRKHTGDKPYECDICQICCVSKDSLKKHIRTHTGEKPYRCDICQKSFSRKGTIAVHMRTHTGEKPYKCDICQVCFVSKDSLKKHIRTHTGEKPYKCDICQKSFSQMSSVTVHMRTHTCEKPYKCGVCELSFTRKPTLAKHMRTHTGEKPYKCDICQKSFSRKGTIAVHIMRTHNGAKPYKCDTSRKSFTTNSNLTRHSCKKKNYV